MSLFERVQQLDKEISAAVERAISTLRDEVTDRLRSSSDDIVRRLHEIKPELPASFLRHEDVAPFADEASAGARNGAFGELRDALIAIDRAGSQAEVLNALLAESGRFASRTAVLLTRNGQIRGWGGHGWSDAGPGLGDVTIAPGGDPGWSRLAEGRGTVRLSSGECAALCSRLESTLPREGVLVPLVLRDQVAAALYADRVDGGPLVVEALQTLVYVAAQAIESLPFRQRRSTPTLHLIDQEPAEGPGLAPWQSAQAQAPAPTPPAPPVERATAPQPEQGTPAAPPAPVSAAPAEAAAPPAEPAPAPAPRKPWWQADDETAAIEQQAPEPAPAGPAPEEPADLPWAIVEEAPAEGPIQKTQEIQETPEVPEVTAEPYAPAEAREEEWSALPPIEELPEVEAEESPAPWGAATAAVPTYAAEPAPEPEPPQDVEVVPEPEPPPFSAATGPIPQTEGHATVLLQRPSFDEPDEPIPSPYAAAAPTADLGDETSPGGTVRPISQGFDRPQPAPVAVSEAAAAGVTATPEVRPPSGVQGPGWAFATTRLQVAPDEEAAHEEARRLARLLVSEIKLYNEEQVEEGRRNRDIYERLKDDIDRSRHMYEERVEQRILNSTDYFYQELVRILAAGDSKALGI